MKKIIVIIGGLAALLFLWMLISPLFIDMKVNEASPDQDILLGKYGSEIEIDHRKEVSLQRSGSFVGAKHFYKGSGRVLIMKDNFKTFVRLEDFNVTNGPALYVVLSKEKMPLDAKGLGEHIELAELKGNIGNQNYVVPESINSDEYNSVVIYDNAFNVVFATASLD